MDPGAGGAVVANIPNVSSRTSREEAITQFSGIAKGDGGVWSQLLGNPFFTAGFGLAGLGAALRYGSQGLRKVGELVKHRMLVDLEITKHDKSYPWVLDWMTAQYSRQLASSATHREGNSVFESLIRRLTPGLHHLEMNTEVIKTAGGSSRTAFALVPGHGRHVLRYKKAFIAVNRERIGKSFDSNGRPFETIKLTTLYHHRHIFEDIFREANAMAMQSTEGKTQIYTALRTTWEVSGQPKRRRPFESVVLEKGLSERILHDVEEFLSARTWYLDRGIPYRRGYLLYVETVASPPKHQLILNAGMGLQALVKRLSFKRLQESWISTLQCSVSASVD
jgi:chaperone BCS1